MTRLILTVLVALAAPGLSQGTRSRPTTFDHTAWDRILAGNVRAEHVDYLTIRRDRWGDLNAYLDHLARADVAGLSHAAQLAFYINLYNASMIRGVIQRFRVGWSPADQDYKIFKDPLVRTGGRTLSLDHLEHKIIRARFKDPRVHVALVCGAEACPPLQARAWRAANLDRDLTRAMQRFVKDSKRNPIDLPGQKLVLSQIFDWFAGDFGGKQAVPGFVERYLGQKVAGFPVSFVPYSWKLNLARPETGDWVRVSSEKLALGATGRWALPGQVLSVSRRQEGRVQVRVPLLPGILVELSAAGLVRF